MQNISSETQMLEWQKGNSIHRRAFLQNGREIQGGECCPDFSCCEPSLLATQEDRDAFCNDLEKRDGLLGVFLGRLLAFKVPDKKIYIAGAK